MPGERKSGIPALVDIPAPAMTIIFDAFRRCSAAPARSNDFNTGSGAASSALAAESKRENLSVTEKNKIEISKTKNEKRFEFLQFRNKVIFSCSSESDGGSSFVLSLKKKKWRKN